MDRRPTAMAGLSQRILGGVDGLVLFAIVWDNRNGYAIGVL
jgi:hypothetical protein